MTRHQAIISEAAIAIGEHCYERNLYDLLILSGAPIVIERDRTNPDRIRYRALSPVHKSSIVVDGKWTFWWEVE